MYAVVRTSCVTPADTSRPMQIARGSIGASYGLMSEIASSRLSMLESSTKTSCESHH